MRKISHSLLIIIFGIVSISSIYAQDEDALPPLTGRIAYISNDLNVYTLIFDENETIPLTEDGDPTHVYQWPTWSTDGRLAYFLTVLKPDGFSTDVFISQDGESAGTSFYSSTTEFFTYAYWSPQNCSNDERCRDLAVLFSSVDDPLFSVKLIHDDAEQTPETLTGQGSPFYYSWSPDGERMLRQRDNRRIDIYDVANDNIISSLPQTPGFFQAPSWSPVDDRWLFGVLGEDRRSTDLVVVTSEDSDILVPDLSGPVAFSWSPDGNAIAYTDGQGPLVVVDSGTGNVISQSSVSGIFAFFWSPDSDHLAYITLATPPGSISADAGIQAKTAVVAQDATGIAWSVLDINTSATRRYGSFLPTREMVYLLSFFDQFAQSHRVWSPDSRYLIYSQITPESRQVINILDTTQTDTVPLTIADGRIGIWSFS